MAGGVRTEIHLDSQATGGAFCLLVDYPTVGWSLPAHLHRDAAETIHVIDGQFEMTIGERPLSLAPGQTVHIPAGVVHSGANTSQAPGQRILIFSPGGMENFFLEAGAPSPDSEVDRAAAVAAAMRHGWEFMR